MKSIIIIGYMGAGKTTVGKALAKELGVMFYDLDWYIETRMHKTVKEIFDEKGEEGFRIIEHNMLHEVAEFENVVVSCGGGTPCFFDNMDYMNQLGTTVYLKGLRPQLLNKSPEEVEAFIKEQLKQREPFYLKAQHIFDIDVIDDYDKIQNTVKKLRLQLGI